MKLFPLLFVLLSSACFGQVTSNEVYEKLGYLPKTDTTLITEAHRFSSKILSELGLFGSFEMPHSELGQLTAYTGIGKEEVIRLIESDRSYYKGSNEIFVYCGYDFDTNWTVVLVYIVN